MPDATIAATHGLRVTATWLNFDDLYPTYAGLLIKHTTGTGTPTYAGLVTDYTSYDDMLQNAGASGIDVTEDLSCDVSGLRISRGRDSIGEPVKAGTLSLTLNDWTGKHDPRKPPAGPSRTGAKIVVEVQPWLFGAWYPLFAGFIESWQRDVDAGEGQFSEIEATATDAFNLLGRAVSNPPTTGPVGEGEMGAARINRLLEAATWLDKWGDLNVTGGHVPMSKTNLEGSILDAMHDVTMSEDGILYAEPDGTLFWYDRYWRGLRREGIVLIDITGGGSPLVPEGGMCPTGYVATDDDLDMVNRAVVWRDVELDPDLPSGDRPEPLKKSAENAPSLSQHGVIANEYGDLPHLYDARSQELADRLVERLGGATNQIGNFELALVKRPQDSNTVAILRWGDQVTVWDDTVTGTPEEFLFELVGIDHNISPDDWTARLRVDRWVDEYLPPTGVTAGTPGHFTPLGATPPLNLADLIAKGSLGQTAAWTTGQFVWLKDSSRARWNGTTWVNGALGDPTSVTQGLPGVFAPPGCVIPLDFEVLVALGPLGSTTRWLPTRWVNLQIGEAWWDGTAWQPGRTPVDATAGTPGTYTPSGTTFDSVAEMGNVRAVPDTPWTVGQYVPLTGPEGSAHWNGAFWVAGHSPGYP